MLALVPVLLVVAAGLRQGEEQLVFHQAFVVTEAVSKSLGAEEAVAQRMG